MSIKENVVLVGMPGVGKNTIGQHLARRLGWRLIDTDAIMEGRTDQPLSKLVLELGTKQFCDFESQIVQNLWFDHMVIAPGGSIVHREASMHHLKRLGMIIYLQAEPNELAKRIATKPDRGIIWFGHQTIEELWRERHPLYKKHADLVIHQNGMSVTDCVSAICQKLSHLPSVSV